MLLTTLAQGCRSGEGLSVSCVGVVSDPRTWPCRSTDSECNQSNSVIASSVCLVGCGSVKRSEDRGQSTAQHSRAEHRAQHGSGKV